MPQLMDEYDDKEYKKCEKDTEEKGHEKENLELRS
jgi:hypothetical protein